MEKALNFTKLEQIKDITRCDRIYFGNEFCRFLIPEKSSLINCIKAIRNKLRNVFGCNNISVSISLPDKKLKVGRTSITITTPRMIDIAEVKNDSPKNCHIRFFRFAPTTFLNPISLNLLTDLAVARFIKFIQAIKRIKTAITEKIYTYLISPGGVKSKT